MASNSARLSLIFSCVGHSYIHMFTAFYFVIVLALEKHWTDLSYAELLALWTPGSILVGAAALPAGWLGDRWSATGMMVVFFIGLGLTSIACGLSNEPVMLLLGLSGIGLFAAIYHPVGIPWLIRNATQSPGKLLGINGIFGSLGVAVAGLAAGGLIDLAGWRAAFILPGILSVVTGLAMLGCVLSGRIVEAGVARPAAAAQSRSDMARVFLILLFTMFCAGIVFQATQTAAPKLFETRLSDLLGGSAFGVGALVALVYGTAAFMQLLGGHLADRYSLKAVYILCWAVQAPMLWLAASFGGLPLVVVVTAMVMLNTGALPAENMLLSRYTPSNRQGLAFGIKFVLSFGAAPLAIQLVAWVQAATGEFYWLFAVLAAIALAIVLAAMLLPTARPAAAAAPQPAAAD